MYSCPNCGGLVLRAVAQTDVQIRVTTRPHLQDTYLEELNEEPKLSMADDTEATCQQCHQVAPVRDWHAAYQQQPPALPWNYDVVLEPMLETPPDDPAWQDIQYGEAEIGPALMLRPRVALLTSVPWSYGLRQWDIVRVRKPRLSARCQHLEIREILQRFFAWRAFIVYAPPALKDQLCACKPYWKPTEAALLAAGCAARVLSPGRAVVNVPVDVDLEAVFEQVSREQGWESLGIPGHEGRDPGL